MTDVHMKDEVDVLFGSDSESEVDDDIGDVADAIVLETKLSESKQSEVRPPESKPLESSQLSPSPLDIRYYNPPYNHYRRAKLMLFSDNFNEHPAYCQLSYAAKWSIIEKIEKACNRVAIGKANEENIPTRWSDESFRDIYHTLCAKISSNISQRGSVKNPYLAKAILNGTINIPDLPKLSSQDLYPAKYVEIIRRIEASKNVTSTKKTSSMYRCRRCHKNECTIENRYNRSLDEGVNLTITCVACGNEWNA